jgi:hypothetical protein
VARALQISEVPRSSWPAAAHLVGPPPGEQAQDDHCHEDHRQHGPGNDADDDEGEQRHRQIERGGGEAARHARAHGADVTEQLQPLAGGALLQREQRPAQHGVHQGLADVAIDGGAGFAQRTGALSAQPDLQPQKAQHARDHGDQRGVAAAGDDAVVDLQQEDGGQQPEQADRQRQPGGPVQVGRGTAERIGNRVGVPAARIASHCTARQRLLRAGGQQVARKQVFDHGKHTAVGLPVSDVRSASPHLLLTFGFDKK